MSPAYAYKVEVRYKGSWRVLDLMISPPGQAIHDCINSVKPKKRHDVRVQRILHSGEFFRYVRRNVCLGIHDTCLGQPLIFEDGTLTADDFEDIFGV